VLVVSACNDAVEFAVEGQDYTRSVYSRFTVRHAEVLDEGYFLANAELFFSALNSLAGEQYVLAHDGAMASLSDDRCFFTLNTFDEPSPPVDPSGQSVPVRSAKAPTKPLVDASTPTVWSAKLSGVALRSLIEHGTTCLGLPWTYKALWQGCARLRSNGSALECESSDGFMLSRAPAATEVQGAGEAVVSGRLLQGVRRVLPDGAVTVRQQGKALVFETENMLVQVPLADVKWPDTDSIVEKTASKDNAEMVAVCNMDGLAAFAQAVADLSNDLTLDDLVLSFAPGVVKCEFKDPTIGLISNTIAADISGESHEGSAVCLGAKMLKAVLGGIGTDRVAVYFDSPLTPVRFEPVADAPGATYIVMPRLTPEQRQQRQELKPAEQTAN
jgi:DNA polymerase III sliding clamp (beta) subunit (PCNA family)